MIVDEVAWLHKHTATTTSRVKNCAVRGFNDIDNHLYQRLWREEHTIIIGNSLGKFAGEIFVDAPYDITTNLFQLVVVENAKQFGKDLIVDDVVCVGEDTLQLIGLLLNKSHGVVDHITEARQLAVLLINDICRGDIARQIKQIIILSLTR